MFIWQTPYLKVCKAAGLKTGNARGFWGGVDGHGDIVATAWDDNDIAKPQVITLRDETHGLRIWQPDRNNGGLLAMWENGSMVVGTTIRLVLIRPKIYLVEGQRDVLCAMVLPGHFAIIALVTNALGRSGAFVEPEFRWPLRVPVEGDERRESRE